MKKINYKALKNKKNNKNDKVFQTLKWICLVGVGILFIELIYFGILVLSNNNKNLNVDLTQNIIETSSGYVTVGSSNFSRSKYHEKIKKEAGIVSVYSDKELVKEIKFDDYYQGVFYDLEEVSSGYIVVGSIREKEDSNKKGIIVKYDKDWNILWKDVYSELDDTVFRSLLVDGDYIYVAGSSIYDRDVIGNEDKGGAIILKYDFSGNIVFSNHFGGNKNGAFYDIVKANDLYYAVGSDTSNNALFMGLNSSLEPVVVKNYEGVNKIGFSSILSSNNSLYVTCASMEDTDNQTVEQATIIKYDYNGNVLKEVKYTKEDYSIWNKIIDYKGSFYVVGDSAIKKGKEGSILVDYIYKGIISKYSYDLNREWTKEFDYDNNDYYKSCMVYKDKIYVVGYTNSKIKELGSSKNNYASFIHKYNFNGTK